MKGVTIFLLAILAIASSSLVQNTSHYPHVRDLIRAGQVPMHGVNLGGWLVTEYWINSEDALFEGLSPTVCNQGEMSIMKALGHAVGDARYDHHWNTFFTEDDIAEMASFQLNAVRVPIGFWIIGYDNHDPSNQQEWKTYAPGGLKYLDRLINEWAPRHNIAVLIDLHAAKGSQNGNDHSSPSNPGNIYWDKYPENVDNSIEVVTFLAERYRNSVAFLGIELLNEPTDVNVNVLKDYYLRANDLIRGTGNDCFIINSPILYEQYAGPPNHWEQFTPPPRYTNVLHDWHKYLIWGFEGQPAEWIINEGVNLIRKDVEAWTGNWLFMGEWCLASSAPFTDDLLKQYATNMFQVLRLMDGGWTMWTWKQGYGPRGDGQGGWSMRDLLRDKIILPSMWQ